MLPGYSKTFSKKKQFDSKKLIIRILKFIIYMILYMLGCFFLESAIKQGDYSLGVTLMVGLPFVFAGKFV